MFLSWLTVLLKLVSRCQVRFEYILYRQNFATFLGSGLVSLRYHTLLQLLQPQSENCVQHIFVIGSQLMTVLPGDY